MSKLILNPKFPCLKPVTLLKCSQGMNKYSSGGDNQDKTGDNCLKQKSISLSLVVEI